MLRLTAFGTPQVHRDGEPLGGAASQRRVLALVSLLAVAGQRGLSRDTVLGILWSEGDPDKARQALTQSLYHTRRALRQEDLIEADAELRLNAAVISSDVAEFEEACSRGDFARAVELHAAPFLDGFFVTGAPEFERWAADTRARLARQCSGACELLASEAEARSDMVAAVQWWKRLASLEPLNSRIAMRLMTALASGGDRAGAIQCARIHERLLREELEVEPDAAFRALADRLQVDTHWMPADTSPAQPAGVPDEIAPDPVPDDIRMTERQPAELRAAAADDNSASRPAAGLFPVRIPWRRPRVRIMAVIGIAVLLVVAATRTIWLRSGSLPQRDMVVVAPFRTSGADPSLSYLREGLVDLLVTKLIEDASTRAADPGAVMSAWRRAGWTDVMDVPRADALRLARRLGANRLVVGSVVGSTSRMVISAMVIDIGQEDLRAQASVEGRPEELTTLVDELVTRLLAKEAGTWDRLVNRTSTSSLALRAYLDGQAAYRRGRYREAIAAFHRALEVDSSFAMAGLGLANAAERINAPVDRARGVAVAWAARHELIERDRVYLTALVGPRYPASSSERESLLAWERAATSVPDRADIWHELGERLFTDGKLLGVADWAARSLTAFRRAADLDPVFASPLQYVVRLTADAGDTSSVRQASRQYLQLDSIGDLAGFVRWRAAVALNDSLFLTAAQRRMTAMPTPSLRTIALWAQYNGERLTDAEHAISVLRSRAVRDADRREAALALYSLAVNRGQPGRAADVLDDLESSRVIVRSSLTDRLQVLVALYAGGDSTQAAHAAARLEARAPSTQETTGIADAMREVDEDACVAAQWRAWRSTPRHGSTVAYAPRATDAGAGSTSTAACAALVDAIVAARTRRADAPHSVQRVDSLFASGTALGPMRGYVNLVLAHLYAQVGDSAAARVAVRRRPHMEEWPYYLAAQLLLEARLAEAAGDTIVALRSYRHYLRLRESPESNIQPELMEVKVALARLAQRP